ncbi:hypothetical protein V1477_007366 [Vespula maculifrons]|uniref:FHA domain-containing protein n=1 Tax=Vespula maculifrons TaxID=7453 RepID=A0ABD2CJE6_VESMC
MSDIIIYLHYLFSITCGECLLRDLRCVLVKIQSKTEPVTVGPLILSSGNIERMSDIIIYLHYLFSITCGECLLRDLRFVLVEIQSKTEPVTVGPLILSSRNIERMSDIIIYLHYLFSITCGECLLRDLRCVLVEIRSKTEPVTVGKLILSSRNIERMSDIIIYLHYLFSITCGECLLKDLRCVLVEIQSKTEPVTVSSLILSSRNIERTSDNNILTLTLCYYLWRMRTTRTTIKTEPLIVKVGRTLDFVVVSRSSVSPLHNLILKRNKSYRILKGRNIERTSDNNILTLTLCYYSWRMRTTRTTIKTEPLIVKDGRTLDFVVVSRSSVSPLHNLILKRNNSYRILKERNIERTSDNNILTLTLCYYSWRMRTTRTTMCTLRNSKQD